MSASSSAASSGAAAAGLTTSSSKPAAMETDTKKNEKDKKEAKEDKDTDKGKDAGKKTGPTQPSHPQPRLDNFEFLKVRKKFWLLPILVMILVFGGLVVLTQGSAVAPFINTIF